MKKLLLLMLAPAFILVQTGCSAQENSKETQGAEPTATTLTRESPKAETQFTDISVQDFRGMIGQVDGLQLLDVRTPGETSQGTVEGAQIIDIYDPEFKQKVQDLDKDKPVAVYCKAGGRSKQAQGIMKDLGFKVVYNVQGGFDAWKSNGYNVEK